MYAGEISLMSTQTSFVFFSMIYFPKSKQTKNNPACLFGSGKNQDPTQVHHGPTSYFPSTYIT